MSSYKIFTKNNSYHTVDVDGFETILDKLILDDKFVHFKKEGLIIRTDEITLIKRATHGAIIG